jgi:hypothetical protein
VSQEKFEIVRKALAALNARDVDGYLACCTDDVELIPATAAIEGGYTGRSGIQSFFVDLRDAAPDMRVEIERLDAVGQNVLAFERGSASGRASEVRGKIAFTTVYEFAGPKITRIQVFLNREEAIEAAALED